MSFLFVIVIVTFQNLRVFWEIECARDFDIKGMEITSTDCYPLATVAELSSCSQFYLELTNN